MSYIPPTLDDFVERFPEFEETPPATINRALDDAMRFVDDTWLEDDYAKAIMLRAAHFIAVGIYAGETFGGVGGSGAIASESIGRISVSYRGGSPTDLAMGTLSTTSYGMAYAELLRLNHPPVLIV
jgi:hypothetical protein